jgi:hypothetical protein
MFELNPIDVLKQRKVNTVSPHFKKVKISEIDLFEGLEEWVRLKLKGRYYITKQPGIDSGGNLKSNLFIGFEDSKELTYFMLACPHLRRN